MISAQNHLQQLNGNRMKRFLLVLFLILGFQSFGQKYAKIGERAGVKYYMHTVADGETLYGIQQIYGVEVEKIQNSNSISDNIEIGQLLYIPVRYHNVNHTVRRQETLYGISKKYGVAIDSLKSHNPSLADGLKRGQQLVVRNLILPIPLKSQQILSDTTIVDELDTSNTILNDSIIEYEVKAGETMYSISKRFMVPIKLILARNNLQNSALQPGQIITIPLKKELQLNPRPPYVFEKDTALSLLISDSGKIDKKFNVAVLLPFNLDTLDTKGFRSYATEYYMGALMAIDSLKQFPVRGSFRFIDYLSKSEPFDSLLSNGGLDSADLIYAPFDFEMSKELSFWAEGKNVKIVYPLANHHAIGIENENAYFMNPNTTSLLTVMASHLSKRDSVQIVLIKTNDSTEQIVYNEFLRITQYLDLPVKIQEANFDNYTYFARKKGLKTLYVLLSKCSPKIDELLQFSIAEEHVEVYGMKEWKKCSSFLKSIENEKGYRFPNPSFLDYHNSELKRIHKVYRVKYNSDLTKMACLGFDATLNMFLYALYGKTLDNGLVHKFKFDTSSVNHINRGAFMLEFKDLEEKTIAP